MTSVRPRAGSPGSGGSAAARGGWRFDRRTVVFLVLLVVYVVYTILVVVHSWVGDFDKFLYDIHIKRDVLTHREYRTIYWYLTIGQRGPVLLAFLPYFLWISWRRCTIRPITAFVAAQVLLNLSVGVVKLATGRIGPKETVDVFQVFDGGNIYPSGHVSNSVVIWGLAAMFVTPRWRRLWIGLAVWVSFSVGIGTVAINTHWFSDIIGGWLAGVLVLLALPWLYPLADRWAMVLYDRIEARLPRWVREPIARRRASRRADAATGPSARPSAGPSAGSAERDAGQLDSTAP